MQSENPALKAPPGGGHIPSTKKCDSSSSHFGINKPTGLDYTFHACTSDLKHYPRLAIEPKFQLSLLGGGRGGLASVSKTTDRYPSFSPLSYPCLQEFLPVGFQVEENTPPGSGEGGPPYQQDGKDDIREGGCHPYHLQRRGWKHRLSACECWCLLCLKTAKKGDVPLLFCNCRRQGDAAEISRPLESDGDLIPKLPVLPPPNPLPTCNRGKHPAKGKTVASVYKALLMAHHGFSINYCHDY